MLFFTVALCASAALANPLKRFSGLTVEVTGPESVASVADLTFTAAITNTGSEDVKVLKYGTILDSLPTRSFTVTKDGANVAFTGVKLSVSLEDTDTAFTTIPAGETVTVSHDVSAIYDYAASGAGTFSFTPITDFKVAGSEDALVPISGLAKVTVDAGQVSVDVADVTKREMHEKRATASCSNTSQRSFISSSYTEGKALASQASSYISSRGASDSLYTAYFGATATSRVTSVLNAVANENSSSRTLSCTDSYGVCDGNVIAYTVIATTNIYYCSIFFNERATTALCSGTTVASRSIRGGTTLHELTHAVADTDDVTYGCSADQALSDANSVRNADNYNCFTTQVYANTQC